MDVRYSQNEYIAETVMDDSEFFDKAVNAATSKLVYTGGDSRYIAKEEAVEAFMSSLEASLGIIDNPSQRTGLNNYIPMIVVTAPDGFWIYSQTISGSIASAWSEKIPYVYRETSKADSSGEFNPIIYRFSDKGAVITYSKQGSDGFTYELSPAKYIEMRNNPTAFSQEEQDIISIIDRLFPDDSIITHEEKFNEIKSQTMATTLNEYMGAFCDMYNRNGTLNGKRYRFVLPSADSNTYYRATQNVSFLAFFQGYPIKGTDRKYNLYTVANAQISNANAIYVTPSSDGSYNLYHKNYCSTFRGMTSDAIMNQVESIGYSVREVIQNSTIPIYACPQCYPNTGLHK